MMHYVITGRDWGDDWSPTVMEGGAGYHLMSSHHKVTSHQNMANHSHTLSHTRTQHDEQIHGQLGEPFFFGTPWMIFPLATAGFSELIYLFNHTSVMKIQSGSQPTSMGQRRERWMNGHRTQSETQQREREETGSLPSSLLVI